MGAIVVLKFPSKSSTGPAVPSPEGYGVVLSMTRENTKRKPAVKPTGRKRVRYVPDWKPLAAKWNDLERSRDVSQKELASIAGASAGMISQLLSGTTPLTIEWALQFASYLNVSVVDIWPDFPFKKLVPGNLTPEEIEIALHFRMTKHKQAIANFLRDLQKSG